MTADELIRHREEMGWTQYFLADALGVTRSSLTHWECGRAPVPDKVAKAIVRAHRKVTQAVEALYGVHP